MKPRYKTNSTHKTLSPDKIISFLNKKTPQKSKRIPSNREVDIISSTPSHYHFITKHETKTRTIYTNVYFMDKKIEKPRMDKSGMVFLESTLLKLLDLYKRSSDAFKSEMEQNLNPIDYDKKLIVDLSLTNRKGTFNIHSSFDFEKDQLDIKKLKVDNNNNNESSNPYYDEDNHPELFIQIDSEENYLINPDEKTLCFRKKIFITAKN